MSDLPSAGDNRLATLADGIRALHRSIVRDAEQIARDAIEAGKLLIEAKQALEHGQWGQWLRENCDLSARTARRYMALARSDLQIGRVANLGLTAAAKAIATDQLRFERIDRLRRKGWEQFVEAGRQYGKIRDTLGGEEQFRAWAADKPHLRYPDEALFWAEIASFTDAGGDLDALLARDDRPKVFHPFAGITEAEIAELRARLGLVEAPPHER
jgi:hypothetical protein